MVTTTRPDETGLDQELREHIARHAAAHHLRAEKLHYAETGVDEPIDEELETTEEISTLLQMARPDLDGDEQAAMVRLLDALEDDEAHTHH